MPRPLHPLEDKKGLIKRLPSFSDNWQGQRELSYYPYNNNSNSNSTAFFGSSNAQWPARRWRSWDELDFQGQNYLGGLRQPPLPPSQPQLQQYLNPWEPQLQPHSLPTSAIHPDLPQPSSYYHSYSYPSRRPHEYDMASRPAGLDPKTQF